jgi:S-DNA-T family DNA segregation ATPase FtsK/SpoIIIE
MKTEFLRLFKRKSTSERARLKGKADLLEYVFRDKGVPGRIKDAESGPLLDLFNFTPDAGVTPKKIFDIVVANDGSARILPQTGDVQIYLPKQERKTLLLEDLLKSSIFKKCRALLPVAVGVDVLGKPCVLDLSETRNILIDGRLGTGKTNLIISMLLSLATCKDSTEVTFIVVDTMNEYGVIDGLPHLSKRITDDKHVEELQKILDLVNTRTLNSDILHTPMILVIDKITDLTPESQQVVRRILQQGPSVGIYCIATGNKTVELSENLQACFDTRVVFNLPESELQQILRLDANALTLLSYGDAVYSIRSQQPERIHPAYISEDCVAKLADGLASKYADYIDLQKNAIRYILEEEPNITDIQRKFGVSYKHATKLRECADLLK